MPDHRRTNRPEATPITRPRRFPRDEPYQSTFDTFVPLSRQDIMRNLKIATIIAFVVCAGSLDASSSWVDIIIVCGLGLVLVAIIAIMKRSNKKGRKMPQAPTTASIKLQAPTIAPNHILPKSECGTGRIMNTAELKKRLQEVREQEKTEKEKDRKARQRERQAAKKEARGEEVVGEVGKGEREE
ncbi:hypothetical protein PRZ48_008836 [Zasmidium cellare]|uniref:Uncharacterized protein n=1 Tax=Zasmidium cellare TaxID=395010 RepID=A0ABR0EGL6_ZASCE|nr:hypothetical protein PRZ48_008836 [Zasmidium cellare]